jgi:hypothetical protein
MKIGKYEFNSKEQAQEKIDALGTATDENGNEYPTHKSTIVQLGNIVLEKTVYNEEGTQEITAPVLSDKWHVDVAWNDLDITTVEKEAVLDEEGAVVTAAITSVDHPYGWKSYAVEIEGDGIHSFFGLNYGELKL